MTGDPEEALSLVKANDPHLVLLDLVLPGTDGIELMGDIRQIADVPVIFLSAYGQEETIARAFENGADDYVVKPFSPMELVARIKAALRKREAPEWAEPSEPFVLGELTIDYAGRRVTLAGRPGGADRHRVRTALRAFGQRRSRDDLRPAAATGLGPAEVGRLAAGAHRREAAPPQAGGRRQQPHIHPQRAERRLPDGGGGGDGT